MAPSSGPPDLVIPFQDVGRGALAREYGIPAVVGVAGATERLATGQTITVDGTNGTVSVPDGSAREVSDRDPGG